LINVFAEKWRKIGVFETNYCFQAEKIIFISVLKKNANCFAENEPKCQHIVIITLTPLLPLFFGRELELGSGGCSKYFVFVLFQSEICLLSQEEDESVFSQSSEAVHQQQRTQQQQQQPSQRKPASGKQQQRRDDPSSSDSDERSHHRNQRKAS
jgi:hypothetical protein